MLVRKRKRSVARQLRLKKLEEAMLNGHTNQNELSAMLNVSQTQVSFDMAIIRDRWKADSMQELDDLRAYRLKQFDEVRRKAMIAFDRSREVQTELSTSKKPCEFCSATGTKMKDGEEIVCPSCQGECVILVETVKESESPGDAAFLSQATTAQREASKLQGLYPDRKNTNVSIDLSDRTRISQTVFSSMPKDDLLLLMDMIEEKKAETTKLQRQRVIEAEVVKKIG